MAVRTPIKQTEGLGSLCLILLMDMIPFTSGSTTAKTFGIPILTALLYLLVAGSLH
jgi:hypothetical protein